MAEIEKRTLDALSDACADERNHSAAFNAVYKAMERCAGGRCIPPETTAP